MIATDLDGTLIHSDGCITDRNRDALMSARSKGVHITICTGRRHSYAMRALRNLPDGCGDIVISSNGAVTRTREGHLLWRTTIPLPLVRRMCAELRDFRNALVFTYDRMEADGSDSRGALLLEDYDHLHSSIRRWIEVNARSIQRINPIESAFTHDNAEQPIQAMLCGTLDRMHRAEALLHQRFPGELDTFRTEYPGSDLCILDILPQGQSKGAALLQLAHARGIGSDEILALGDNWNDEPMLRVAGHGVVLANAPDAFRDHAIEQGWTIGRSADEDGVSIAVEALLPERSATPACPRSSRWVG